MPNSSGLPSEIARQVGAACLCLHLQRAARSVARSFDEALRPVGLTNGQFALLMSLSRPSPVSIGSLAPELGMDRTTLTAYLKPLERHGLLHIVADPDDRRSRIPTLTDEGRLRLLKAYPLWQAVQDATLAQARLPDPDRFRGELRALGP